MKFFNSKPALLAFFAVALLPVVSMAVSAQGTDCVSNDDCQDLCTGNGLTEDWVCVSGICETLGAVFCDDGLVGSYDVSDLFTDDGKLCCAKAFEGPGSIDGVCVGGRCVDSVPHATVISVIHVDGEGTESSPSDPTRLIKDNNYKVEFSIQDADDFGRGSTTDICLGDPETPDYDQCISGRKVLAARVEGPTLGNCTGPVTLSSGCSASCTSPGTFTAELVDDLLSVRLYAMSEDTSRPQYGPIVDGSWDPSLYEWHNACNKFVCIGVGCPVGCNGLVGICDRTTVGCNGLVGICDRTPQVRDAILSKIGGSITCDQVAGEQLAQIRGTLAIPDTLNNPVFSLKEGDFDCLTNLNRLNLDNNDLESLPVGIFDGLTKLKYLWISSNNLSSLDVDVFDGLTNLTWLELDNNDLESLPVDVFDGLTNLERLWVFNNNLESLPVDVFDGLTKLKYLWISSNNLSSLDVDVFDGLTNLYWLDLDTNDLESLDVGIFDGLTKLEILFLGVNDLESLDVGVFDGLTNLKDLNLHNNSLESLDVGIFDGLTKLNWLYLDTNDLESLDVGIFDGLTNLNGLLLDYNGLESLDVGIFDGLTKLNWLYLGGNDLESLDVGIFDGLTNLNWLYLGGNDLESLPPGVFDNLTILIGLYLHRNKLVSLPPGVFDELQVLEVLSLEHQRPAYRSLGFNQPLPAGIFDNNQKLKRLYIRYNSRNLYSSLPCAIFQNLLDLERLGTMSLEQPDPPLQTSAPFAHCVPRAAFGSRADDFSSIHQFDGAYDGQSYQGQSITICPGSILPPGGCPDISVPPVVNNPPVFRSSSSFSVREHSGGVGTVGAVDNDIPDSVTGYSVSGGLDRARFSITVGGVLSFKFAPNYENPQDSGTDNVYLLEVEATSGDGGRRLTARQNISVTVVDVDEAPYRPSAPVLSSPSSTSLLVDWYAPGGAGPSIVDYDVGYGRNSNGPFTDWPHSGAGRSAVITGLSAGTLYYVRVLARNAEGDSSWSEPASFITGSTSPPPVTNNPPSFSSVSTFTALNENLVFIGVIVAVDSDSQDSVTGYVVSGGLDSARFSITNDGGLTFISAPDYEAPVDNGGNNVYNLIITATSGTGSRVRTATHSITVTVDDVVESGTPPVCSVSVCDRTSQVMDAILSEIGSSIACDEVPAERLAEISRLYITRNPISSVKEGDFACLTGLKILYLSHSSIGMSSLPVGVFGGLTNLETLALRSNSLVSLPVGVFGGLDNLNGLYLDSNSLVSLPVGVFGGLDNLKTLLLANNSLVSLPVGVFGGLTSLRRLHIDSNGLVSLPVGVFAGLDNLETLNLDSNSLDSLDVGVFDGLTNLNGLHLRDNNLESLPVGVFGGLTNLKTLAPSYNRLESLPVGVFADLKLTWLELRDNRLESLPVGVFAGLTNLTWLYLNNNDLKSLPPGVFDDFTELTTLLLDSNGLESLPVDVFDDLTSLHYLSIVENDLVSLPDGVFENLTNVRSLVLSGNKFNCTPRAAFGSRTDGLGIITIKPPICL